jgi:hypothetical protein
MSLWITHGLEMPMILASGRNMARATLGQSLAVSAFPRYVPV